MYRQGFQFFLAFLIQVARILITLVCDITWYHTLELILAVYRPACGGCFFDNSRNSRKLFYFFQQQVHTPIMWLINDFRGIQMYTLFSGAFWASCRPFFPSCMERFIPLEGMFLSNFFVQANTWEEPSKLLLRMPHSLIEDVHGGMGGIRKINHLRCNY